MQDDDALLSEMRNQWAPEWRIWRAKRSRGGEPGDWYASRMVETAGPEPTVVGDSAADLAEALRRQRLLAEQERQAR